MVFKRPAQHHQNLCKATGGFFLVIICGVLLGCSSPSDLEWNQKQNYRWAEIPARHLGSTGFEQVSPFHSNIFFKNQITNEEIGENRHYLIGSGVAAGDIDGDGFVDLYFARLNGPNRLYKNLGGMMFENITDEAGVSHEGYYSTGAVFADINGNGHLDLLVTSMHKENVLYVNNGEGRFERNEDSGLGPAKGSTTMALADITGNGYPDLYIANYKEQAVADLYTSQELGNLDNLVKEEADSYTLIPPFDKHYKIVTRNNEAVGLSELGEVDEFYINRGGTFEKVSDTKNMFLNEHGEPFGLQPDWGLTARFQDLNNDGLSDLYVCNDFHTPDRVWINQGNGTFNAIEWSAIRNLSFSCMAVDFSDINRDGQLDIFTTEMLSPEHHRRLRQAGSYAGTGNPDPTLHIGEIELRPMYNRNSMFLKREDNTYAEISSFSGTEATGWSWATRFMDINLDGYEDLIVNTGFSYDHLDIDAQVKMLRKYGNLDDNFLEFMLSSPRLELPNRMLMNNRDLTFTDVSFEWGIDDYDISHGMAIADLNNDGALDVIVNRMDQEAVIYQNTTRAPRIAVRLKGKSPNTQAIGAKIDLYGGPAAQQKEITGGGDYASGSDTMVMFAADPDNLDHTLLITWPDGQQSKIDSVKANRIYEIDEAKAGGQSLKEDTEETNRVKTIFKDVSDQVRHQHHEDPFNDFDLQPLLPRRLSQSGPGIAWIDINQNDRDDLIITSGKDGEPAVFENQSNGSFSRLNLNRLTEKAAGDQTAVIGWREGNRTRVVIGSANYEQGSAEAPSAYIYSVDPAGKVQKDSVPGILSTTGPLAAADVNDDGYVDLFIGGRFKPGQYPRDANSRLFKNEHGTFKLDSANSGTFSDIGLVTGAVFTDFNQDGSQDLLISTEWGTLRLFENNNGLFHDVTDEVELSAYTGWWNSVATGDFNNDGYPDIVATNQGLNSHYLVDNINPLRMYYDDLNYDGRIDIVEAYANESGHYIPSQRLYKFQSLPVISNRISSHRQFASITLNEILGNRLSEMPYKDINAFKHMIFINKGNGFEAHPLPVEAQFTVAFYAGVADFDNDGNEDLFLSQNFFAVPREVPRMDAGRGLMLTGDGEGNFTPVSGSESGIKIYGEQRGAGLGDFNQDGRVDLAVSQNGAGTKLYLNQMKKRGYRIVLNGPDANSNGVGSSIRLVYDNGEKGPKREIQSGSGHFSQNSYSQVMGIPSETEIKEIEVVWFDGTRQTIDYIEGKKDYEIFYPARVN